MFVKCPVRRSIYLWVCWCYIYAHTSVMYVMYLAPGMGLNGVYKLYMLYVFVWITLFAGLLTYEYADVMYICIHMLCVLCGYEWIWYFLKSDKSTENIYIHTCTFISLYLYSSCNGFACKHSRGPRPTILPPSPYIIHHVPTYPPLHLITYYIPPNLFICLLPPYPIDTPHPPLSSYSTPAAIVALAPRIGLNGFFPTISLILPHILSQPYLSNSTQPLSFYLYTIPISKFTPNTLSYPYLFNSIYTILPHIFQLQWVFS